MCYREAGGGHRHQCQFINQKYSGFICNSFDIFKNYM